MIGGVGPKGQRLAARYADIWSAYAESANDMSEFGPRIATLEAACAEVGRDPSTIERSAGVSVRPLQAGPDPTGVRIAGSTEQIADKLRTFLDGGYTRLELWPTPQSIEAVEALAPVVKLLRADER